VSDSTFSLEVDRRERFAFEILFDDATWAPLFTDEPPPLGEGGGPNPARLLGAAVGNCLAASLLFCLERARIDVAGLLARVEGDVIRNERGRLRVGQLRVRLEPTVRGDLGGRMERCLEIFEDFCVVTQSVRDGVEVHVDVTPQPADREKSAERPGSPRPEAAVR
jgi:organic hydroperoxide reductase OsmC/OhrA